MRCFRHDPRSALRHPLRTDSDRPGNCAQPLLPSATLHGHRVDAAGGLARLRGIKAEGGWAVVATEETEIHPTADCEPFHEGRLWDDRDIPAMALMADAVHEHGALAAIEIMHHGGSVANWGTRLHQWRRRTARSSTTIRCRRGRWTRQDIRNLRAWHRDAAIRSKKAGFDIVYVYATHDLSIAHQFLQRRKNDRIDEYGGSLENRARLLRELIEDTKDAVGDRCAVAVRFCGDELDRRGRSERTTAKRATSSKCSPSFRISGT